MNPYQEWSRYDSLDKVVELFEQDCPTIGAFDTETTGLFIRKDKPFLIGFGWIVPNQPHGVKTDVPWGRTFCFEPVSRNMETFMSLAERLKILAGHNIKYDLHMIANIGYEYEKENLFEVMALARLTTESMPKEAGRYSLALKDLAVQYIHESANGSEKEIKLAQASINKERSNILYQALKQFPTGELDKRGRSKRWTKKMIEDFLKDKTNDASDLPKDIREVYIEWRKQYPEANYLDVYNAEPVKMRRYLQDDIISTLGILSLRIRFVQHFQQERTLERENDLILRLWRMERVGLSANRDYLEESRIKLKKEIRAKRVELHKVAGEIITVHQKERIKQIFKSRYGIVLEKCDKKALKGVQRSHSGDAKRMAQLIGELRRLEKWYSTYCLRILEMTKFDGRFYTQINQCGAVSGRVSSDAQQFPKERILTLEGQDYEAKYHKIAPKKFELFNPRRMFEPTDKGKSTGYTSMWYLDWSQLELRAQADYTIKVSGGDTNLCRAYMPFKCKHYKTGEIYDYNSREQRNRWDELRPGHPQKSLEKLLKEGWSAWYVPETGKSWVPTDVHSETTHNALTTLGYQCKEKYKSYEAPALMIDERRWVGDWVDKDAFELARKKGKTFNFLALYGGGMAAAMDQLDLPEIIAIALLNGYKEAFPHVKIYQQQVTKQYRRQGYVTNLYSRRYMLWDGNDRKAYKLANYLIQGGTADMCKECIIKIDDLLITKRTRMVLQVHDEIVFEVWQGEEYLIPQILEIMENHDNYLIPIIAEPERTFTDWSEVETANVTELIA